MAQKASALKPGAQFVILTGKGGTETRDDGQIFEVMAQGSGADKKTLIRNGKVCAWPMRPFNLFSQKNSGEYLLLQRDRDEARIIEVDSAEQVFVIKHSRYDEASSIRLLPDLLGLITALIARLSLQP